MWRYKVYMQQKWWPPLNNSAFICLNGIHISVEVCRPTFYFHIEDDRCVCKRRTNTLLTGHIRNPGIILTGKVTPTFETTTLASLKLTPPPQKKTTKKNSSLYCHLKVKYKHDLSTLPEKQCAMWHLRQQISGPSSLSLSSCCQCQPSLAVLRSVDTAQSKISKSQHGRPAVKLAKLQQRFADDFKKHVIRREPICARGLYPESAARSS